MMKYMQMDYEELKKLSYDELLEAKSEIENTDPLDVNRYNIIVNTLAERQAEQAKQVRVDAAIQESTQVVDEMMVGENLTLRQVISDEFSYQLISISMKSKLQTQATNYINEIDEIQRAAAEREANLIYQLKQKDAKLNEYETQISELEKQVNTLTFERDEAFKVRDNAAAEIDEYKAEAEKQKKSADEKQKQLEELRKGNGQANIREEEKKAQEAWIASRIKVTEMYEDEEDLKRATWKVRLLGDYEGIGKDGQLIPINYLEKGKYLKVSQEEAARFRAEAAATAEQSSTSHTDNVVPSDALVEIPEVQPVEDFRPTEAETVLPVCEPSDIGGVVPEAYVTHEELEARLETFKQEVNRKFAELIGEEVA